MTVGSPIEKFSYFLAAKYFRFFANISFRRWKPRVIAVTGSVGKTTMLHMIEFELGDRAHYSHNANSAFGIAMDILGIEGVYGSRLRWLKLVALAPFRAFSFKHTEEFYVVEIDASRPGSARFSATWLKPEITLWVSFGLSHAVYFEYEVKKGKLPSVKEGILQEFASLPQHTTEVVYIDGDNPDMVRATEGIKAEVIALHRSALKRYNVYPTRTDFTFDSVTFHFSEPQPKDVTIQLLMLEKLMNHLKLPLRTDLSGMPMPPGRCSFFQGKKGLKIIDSSYNAHLISMESILEMAKALHAGHKWLIIGDIVEQGSIEEQEHVRLAELIAEVNPEMVILVGRRTKQFTAPKLKELGIDTRTTLDPHKALKFIEDHTGGEETLIFKGSQYLEWIIEQLLENPEDAAKLPRRDKAATKRRENWGLK